MFLKGDGHPRSMGLRLFLLMGCNKKSYSKVNKEITRGRCLDAERIEKLTIVFPLQYLSMFEQMKEMK